MQYRLVSKMSHILKNFVAAAITISICLQQHVNCTSVSIDSYGPTPRIINGEEAKPHSMPYVVAITTVINGNHRQCAGTLLQESIVLTAASCLDGAESAEILLGAHNLDEEDESDKILITQSEQFIIHELYNSTKPKNDIALILLPAAVTLTENITLVQLPAESDIFNSYAGEMGTVAGWGKTSDTDPETSTVLMNANLTIISSSTCNLAYLFQLGSGQICTTGTHGPNICLGDGGGPLVVDGLQVGIVSFGSDLGCAAGRPGVYTRITSYLSWLYGTMEMYSEAEVVY